MGHKPLRRIARDLFLRLLALAMIAFGVVGAFDALLHGCALLAMLYAAATQGRRLYPAGLGPLRQQVVDDGTAVVWGLLCAGFALTGALLFIASFKPWTKDRQWI